MDTVTRTLAVPATDTILSIKDITLTETSITLKEAVVTAVKATVVARQDYSRIQRRFLRHKTECHSRGSSRNCLESRLGSDGSITSNGKTVTKILVGGKEFSATIPPQHRKTFLPELVDKVQVVDRKSDLARLTGVDDGGRRRP